MRTTVHKILPFLLLLIIGCYTAPKHPTLKEHQKDYFDYHEQKDYPPVAALDSAYYYSYINWQQQQRLLYWSNYYNLNYRNHYPYYASYNHYHHIQDSYHNPIENQNVKVEVIVRKEVPKNNYSIEKRVWKNRQNTSRISRPTKMEPKPHTQQEWIAHQQAKQVVERKVIKKKKPLTQQEWIAKQQAEMKKNNE